MGKFSDLLFYPEKPLQAQARADEKLPSMLSNSNLNLWRLGDRLKIKGTRYVLGIAVWSLYDLRLLDALDEALSQTESNERVDVFSIDSCQSHEEIRGYVPNLEKILHPPVVGVWQDGKQIKQASGYAGRKILVDAFSLDHEELIKLS
ncbi:MAG TPA: hypothetical protein PKY82_12715 [Pyrinomonadaceae bacterium]|nr:hypothetical protein [Pyrinomonadaceae bacterium]